MNVFLRVVLRTLWASVVLVMAVAFLMNKEACAFVKVDGVQPWLAEVTERSLDAVWSEAVKRSLPNRDAVLKLVAKRLFPGLVVEDLREDGDNLYVRFAPSQDGKQWKAVFNYPKLSPFLSRLFEKDAQALRGKFEEMLDHLSFDVLRWSSGAFQEKAEGMIESSLPGWKGAFVFSTEEESFVLEVSFTPKDPIVVAFRTSFSSLTIPNILQADLEEETLEVLSDYIGLPVQWVSKHKKDISRQVASSLEEKWQARKLKGKVEVDLTPQAVSSMKVNVESQKYVLRAWLTTYIGSEGRYPEVGIHFGRRTVPLSGFDLELYGEGIVRVDNGDLESRLGARWLLWKDVWVGAERVFPDDEYWGRVWFDKILDGVYGWARFNEENEVEAAVGWRLREHISWELFYDSREEDEFCVRLVGNL